MDGRAIYIPAVEEAIKRYLKAHGLTMQDMADRLGVSQQAISGAIRRGIGVNTAKRWSEEFGFNVEFLTTGTGNLLAGNTTAFSQQRQEPNTVPLLPIFAQAGSLVGWSDAIEEVKCERVISPVKDVDMAVHIYGESMYPDIPNGSVCYVRRVSGRIIDWGRAYILDTVDGPVLKYLTPGADDEHIRCQSANHDPKFAPFEVLKSDILGMYRVVMCMKMM
jgi:transcriptional regulator with XRE-family HTH domain